MAKKVVVVGLGKTGLSCVRWLRAQGAEVAVMDTRTTPPALRQLQMELPDTAVLLGGFDVSLLAAADEIVVSPGIPLDRPELRTAADSGIPIIGDIELFARTATAPVIAITGSNGKSTVTTLVGQMMRHAGLDAAVGGNLGIPVLDLMRADADWYVLELSSFQLETTTGLAARAATVLNLSPDHLDRYPSMAAYGAAKARIFTHAERALVNRDDPIASALAAEVNDQVGFSLGEPASEADFGLLTHNQEVWLAQGQRRLMPATDVRMPGRHNLANALAALALANMAGASPETGCELLRNFPGLPHRSELVRDRRGVRWINDSKGTNPGATMAALAGIVNDTGDPDGVAGMAVLIAGGDSKGADFFALSRVAQRYARAVVLIGRDAALIEQALRDVVPLFRAADMDEAVQMADRLAQPGDSVLLSPACASFDMFEDYQHRGRAFAAAVAGLAP
ncbi:MAG: UDP-N-acetylmuramoyl-L-alanine--D-glutamate ligase [Lamprobacter sp.]|uniref:UDP-N-acetylmuramoyl-L-alanine--D-glutamate ligase n=1 Tax=Lamprobacter sp. TaxID=3100796 RepID=UPI002B25FE84|nr:UDP-N-acetylmuramoyl-L-alanine--D-glutamate ligase [Lamprobacter sp.]MEA3640203.1 UDP-N-acetylmuramoyl-L-alanine--D-glutamate ligase [Lamprobacter sp.]